MFQHVILTNDDGIDAPGIRALAQAVQGQGVIVAPQAHLSGCGHQVTTTRPIEVERRSEREFAVGGTPADCVRLALTHLYPKTELVLSGINAGGNLGADVYISGTLAAVREAALHRIPAIAFSHYRQGKRPLDWERASRWAARVLAALATRPLPPGAFWNVNLPHPQPEDPEPELVFCQPCTQPLPIAYQRVGDGFLYQGRYADRPRDPGGDVEVCFSGQIAITQISV